MSMMLVNRIDKKTIISWFIQMEASISDFGRHGILPPPAGPPPWLGNNPDFFPKIRNMEVAKEKIQI